MDQKKYNIPRNERNKLKALIYDENCHIEREIIDYCSDYINDRIDNVNEQVCIYSYDGFRIPNTGKFHNNPIKVNNFLVVLSKNLKENLGIDIKVVLKQFNYESEKWLNFLKIMEDVSNPYRPRREPKLNLNGKYLGEVVTDNLFTEVKEQINVFKSSMADGSTTKLWNDIEELRNTEKGKDMTILSVLNRRTLIKNFCKSYQKYTKI